MTGNMPVYKKGSRTEAQNYRPISLTSVPCKLLEHIMLRHIMIHLDAHNMLIDHQHGFRSNRSFETQLINTIEDLACSINYRNQTDLLITGFLEGIRHSCAQASAFKT